MYVKTFFREFVLGFNLKMTWKLMLYNQHEAGVDIIKSCKKSSVLWLAMPVFAMPVSCDLKAMPVALKWEELDSPVRDQ